MKPFILFSFALSTLLLSSFVAHAEEPVAVKKSKSGICHDQSSAHYERTKHFTAFSSMEDCLKSGGRAPSKKSSAQKE